MNQQARPSLKQRADYTHKFNMKTGRHGWLRLTPAYSLKVVEEILAHHDGSKRVLDPFCGTGTTALSAIYHGHTAETTDINPFLVWLATAKTRPYSEADLSQIIDVSKSIQIAASDETGAPVAPPPIHKIERWWSPNVLRYLCHLKGEINRAPVTANQRDLLDIAFCRTLIGLSYAAFNHQSMSFKENLACIFDTDPDSRNRFCSDVQFVLDGAKETPEGFATVHLQDARNLQASLAEKFDLVVTSPPYANRMSYIRELRPYMYWLGYFADARGAGELDWQAIGGTWGIATSRLNDWKPPTPIWDRADLEAVCAKIAESENKNGALLANYVAKYCDDMAEHFQSLSTLLNVGARIHYIVGNSTFYGTLVSTEVFYKEMMAHFGFIDIEVKAIRKRNSKKELIEFDVSATWPR